jgi:hypothetical protein
VTPDDLGLIAYNAAEGTSHTEWPAKVQESGREMWRRVGVAVDKASRQIDLPAWALREMAARAEETTT